MLPLILMAALTLGASDMPVVNFQGQQFNFPPGTSEAQIGDALKEYMVQSATARSMPSNDSSSDVRTENTSRVPTESYLQEEETLQSPVGLTAEQQKFADNIAQIETGGLAQRGVRTMVRPSEGQSGSSAYGKYQITHGLLSGTIRNGDIPFTEQEMAAANELLTRQEMALALGGRDRVHYQSGGSKYGIAQKWAKEYGYDDVEAFLDDFDYGGTLGLAEDGDFQVLYESFARKLLNKTLEDAGGDMLAAAGVWHGGPKGAGSATELYKQKMKRLLEAGNGDS